MKQDHFTKNGRRRLGRSIKPLHTGQMDSCMTQGRNPFHSVEVMPATNLIDLIATVRRQLKKSGLLYLSQAIEQEKIMIRRWRRLNTVQRLADHRHQLTRHEDHMWKECHWRFQAVGQLALKQGGEMCLTTAACTGSACVKRLGIPFLSRCKFLPRSSLYATSLLLPCHANQLLLTVTVFGYHTCYVVKSFFFFSSWNAVVVMYTHFSLRDLRSLRMQSLCGGAESTRTNLPLILCGLAIHCMQ